MVPQAVTFCPQLASGEGDRERCLACRMDGYVSKSLQREALFKAVREVLTQLTSPQAVPV